MPKLPKNIICLWFNGDAEEAARFYAQTFPDSSVDRVHPAPGDFHSGKKGDVLTVEFTVMGIPCLGLNGGPAFKHNEAFSFQVATADQAETDRYWNAIVGNGGQESACGWCKDKWGFGLPPGNWSSGYDSPRGPDPGREQWASERGPTRSSACWRTRSETWPRGCRWPTSAARSGSASPPTTAGGCASAPPNRTTRARSRSWSPKSPASRS